MNKLTKQMKKYVSQQPLGRLTVHVNTELEPSEVEKLKKILKDIEQSK